MTGDRSDASPRRAPRGGGAAIDGPELDDGPGRFDDAPDSEVRAAPEARDADAAATPASPGTDAASDAPADAVPTDVEPGDPEPRGPERGGAGAPGDDAAADEPAPADATADEPAPAGVTADEGPDRGASPAASAVIGATTSGPVPSLVSPASTTPMDIDVEASAPVSTLAATAPGAVTTVDPAPHAVATATALTWVSAATLAPAVTETRAAPVDAAPDLLARRPRRSPFRAGVLVPLGILLLLAGTYTGGALLWPLHEVPPTIDAVAVQPAAAVAATPSWPGAGGAAVSVEGISGTLASSGDPASIASITKVVTALVVLNAMPLAPGESGPSYYFSAADSDEYWWYLSNGESALDVPVDGTLTQYQLLQGALIGSANNYADRLAREIWPSDRVFADAANAWLATHGVTGITITDPTGIDAGNTATPEALLVLAQKAMANPVIAEIVGTKAVELPGAGLVENTNALMADPGVVGIKTGTLDAYNLLAAKEVQIGTTTVRLYASVVDQPDSEARFAAARALFSQLETELQLQPSVPADTTVGVVRTPWGEQVQIRTASDADVVLWNGGVGSPLTTFDLGEEREAGDVVGTLSVTGPLDQTTVDLRLASDIEDPTPWWRLTHPLELLGLVD